MSRSSKWFLRSRFLTKISYTFILFTMRATWPGHHILVLIILISREAW
jgi:hypothetical protein